MFQFSGFPSYDYFIHHMMTEYCSAGFPHSEICGSMDICSYPQLIAACHVLLRLLMPRHSPCALSSLTSLGSPFELNYMSFFPEIEYSCLPFYGKTHSSSLHCSVFKVQRRHLSMSLVGLGGLEPPTSRLSGVRSSLLSYKPIPSQVCALTTLFLHPLVEMRRIELLTSCVQSRRSPS